MNQCPEHLDHAEVLAELQRLRKKIEQMEADQSGRKPALGFRHIRLAGRRWFLSLLGFTTAVFLALVILGAQGKPDALFIEANGYVGINRTNPERTLDVNGDALVRGQLQAKGTVPPGSQPLPASSGVVIGDSDIYFTNSTHSHTGQGNKEGFAAIENDGKDFNALMILGRNRTTPCCNRIVGMWDKVGIGTGDPKETLDVRGNGVFNGSLTINGVVNATNTNPMRNRMYPEGPLIYQDIFDAKDRGVISKLGNPAYDDTTYRSNPGWNDRRIIKYGGNQEARGNGARVNVPTGYDTLWIRVLGDRWATMHVYFLDGAREDIGNWTGGFRDANSYTPDGAVADSYAREHQWVPIPVRRAGSVAVISNRSDKDFWISGVAFSKNPWGHAAQSALGYHWKVNGGDSTTWVTENAEGDILSQIDPKSDLALNVPVVSNGRDKLLYMVERNFVDTRSAHSGITVNGSPIERLLATYDNPFARHWNGKLHERYLAARIPASLIPSDARFVTVRFKMSKQNGNGLRFREIGTHDLETPF